MKRKSERPLSYKFMNSDYFPGKYPKHPPLPKKKGLYSGIKILELYANIAMET